MSKPFMFLAAALLAGCSSAPSVPPATKNAYDLDSPEGKAIMSKSPLPNGKTSGTSPATGG